MRLAWAAVALSLLPSFTEAAQQPRATGKRGAAPAAAESGPDVFAGYSYTRAGDANLNGWELSGSLPYRRRLRLAVDLSGHYGSFGGADLKQLTLLAGPRMTWRFGRLRPFAQAMAGASRSTATVALPSGAFSDSTTGWGLAPGAGADYRLTRRWAIRAQAELLFLRAAGVWDKDPRLAVGAVYQLGH